MKRILFSPFDLKKWLLLGLSCFLAEVASYSSNLGGNYSGGSDESSGGEGIWSGLESFFGEWAALALGLGIFLIIALACLFIAIAVALIWVSCHGTFVFIDNIVHDRTEITAPWKKFSPQAWQLFWFYLATTVVIIGGIVLWVALGIFLMKSGAMGWNLEDPVGLGILILPVVAISILWMIGFFGMEAIVVPRMYGQQCGILQACYDAWELFCDYPGSWLKFMLFFLLVWVGVFFVILLSCLLTCCLAGLPYFHHVICLPVYVFVQLYYLTFLAQFGEGWNVFPSAPPEISGGPEPLPGI